MIDRAEEQQSYSIDTSHSSVHFSVKHLMIARVRGTFKIRTGTVRMQQAATIPAAVTVTIDAASVDTGVVQRDDHLRSPDFLDSATFPDLRFASDAIRQTGPEAFEMSGMLAMRGVERPVTIAARVLGRVTDPSGTPRLAYQGTAQINRKDWGLTWNQALEAGAVVVGEEIQITLDVQVVPAGVHTAG